MEVIEEASSATKSLAEVRTAWIEKVSPAVEALEGVPAAVPAEAIKEVLSATEAVAAAPVEAIEEASLAAEAVAAVPAEAIEEASPAVEAIEEASSAEAFTVVPVEVNEASSVSKSLTEVRTAWIEKASPAVEALEGVPAVAVSLISATTFKEISTADVWEKINIGLWDSSIALGDCGSANHGDGDFRPPTSTRLQLLLNMSCKIQVVYLPTGLLLLLKSPCKFYATDPHQSTVLNISCQDDGLSHDILTTVYRSKADCPVPEEMVTVSVDGSVLVLERIAKIMSYLRLGSLGKVTKKKRKDKDVKGLLPSSAAEAFEGVPTAAVGLISAAVGLISATSFMISATSFKEVSTFEVWEEMNLRLWDSSTALSTVFEVCGFANPGGGDLPPPVQVQIIACLPTVLQLLLDSAYKFYILDPHQSTLLGFLCWLCTLLLDGPAQQLTFDNVRRETEFFGETFSSLKFAQRASAVEICASRVNNESTDALEELVAINSPLSSVENISNELADGQCKFVLAAGSSKDLNNEATQLSNGGMDCSEMLAETDISHEQDSVPVGRVSRSLMKQIEALNIKARRAKAQKVAAQGECDEKRKCTEVANGRDSSFGITSYDTQGAKMKERARQRTNELQEEEEERKRTQKATQKVTAQVRCDEKGKCTEVANGRDSSSGITSYDAQSAKMKERARQRANELREEEEERQRTQKARAMVKLEELNIRLNNRDMPDRSKEQQVHHSYAKGSINKGNLIDACDQRQRIYGAQLSETRRGTDVGRKLPMFDARSNRRPSGKPTVGVGALPGSMPARSRSIWIEKNSGEKAVDQTPPTGSAWAEKTMIGRTAPILPPQTTKNVWREKRRNM